MAAFSSAILRRTSPPSRRWRSFCASGESSPGWTSGRSARATISWPRSTYARIQEGKILIPVVVGDDAWVPPLLRPLARRGIDETEAIADAVLGRKPGPPENAAPEWGRVAGPGVAPSRWRGRRGVRPGAHRRSAARQHRPVAAGNGPAPRARRLPARIAHRPSPQSCRRGAISRCCTSAWATCTAPWARGSRRARPV